MGASRYRRRDVVEQRCADSAQRRYRVRRSFARPSGCRALRKLTFPVTEISFYHLLHTPLERALQADGKGPGKRRPGGDPNGSDQRAEALSGILWTYEQNSFLPHGTAADGSPDKQPVWITPDDENPNGADILVLTDGAAAGDIGAWRRCLEMFDGRDETAVTDAAAGGAITRLRITTLPTGSRPNAVVGKNRDNPPGYGYSLARENSLFAPAK